MKSIKIMMTALAAAALMTGTALADGKKQTCCEKALADGKDCKNKCCLSAHKNGKSCEKCNPNEEDLKAMRKAGKQIGKPQADKDK